MFSFFDEGGGYISILEFGNLLWGVGCLVTDKEIQDFEGRYDPRQTGKIDYDDFVKCVAEC